MAVHDKADQSVDMKEDRSLSTNQADNELTEALRNYIPGSDDEKKLVRKIDFFLIPILWIMYILNYVDRTNNVSTATAACQASTGEL
jgi:hypothetical protein